MNRGLLAALAALMALMALAGCSTLPVPAPPPDPVALLPAPPVALPLPEAPAPAASATVQPPPVAPITAQDDADAVAEIEARSDLWQRVRQGMAMADLDDERVHKWEAYYAARPDYVARMMTRGSRYLFHVVEEAQARGLPMELALLPFIESAFDPQAKSQARAVGMWQFVSATGRDFDLRQNLLRDDRKDVVASTRAALDYLVQLNRQFNDWHLALAAYNWGQGSVARAIRRNEGLGQPTDYLSLRMPEETRNYVPKLLAVKNIVLQPEAYGLSLPPLENHPAFQAVSIDRDIDVALAARLAGMDEKTFRDFNPQHAKPVILAAGTSEVLLPYDAAQHFAQALHRYNGPMASWTVWVAPRTLSPAQAAKMVGSSEAALREVNRIPPRMMVRAGSALLVPRKPAQIADVGEHLADNAAMTLVPDAGKLRRVVLKVGRRGDSVAGLARRYRLKASDVAQWNDVTIGTSFKAGTRVVVMLPPKKKTTRLAGGGNGSAPKPATRTARSPR
jgi:membrane-bound lytic murein transglycosylase D